MDGRRRILAAPGRPDRAGTSRVGRDAHRAVAADRPTRGRFARRGVDVPRAISDARVPGRGPIRILRAQRYVDGCDLPHLPPPREHTPPNIDEDRLALSSPYKPSNSGATPPITRSIRLAPSKTVRL